MVHKFPYQNLSLVNLPRERWKPVPDFEGSYEVSNYGRIRSVSRKVPMNTPGGGEYFTQERIRKAKLETRHNKTINKPLHTLVITLDREGVSTSYSVARLVYYAFKAPFNLRDRTIYITYKDGDGRNIHISNLVKSDISTIKLNSYRTGRAVSRFKALRKQVTQFDLDGNPLRTFDSMYEAGRELGINERAIAAVISGKGHLHKGFFWRIGRHTKKINLARIDKTSPRDTINYKLAKRLGIRKINRLSPPAFLNMSTKSMPGEKWLDMPAYKGLYQVSSFGRVKALKKITVGKQHRWQPEQIQRLVVNFRMNPRGKKIAGSMFASVSKAGKKKLVSVPRLVYYLYVKKFNLANSTLRVYYKDGNSLNVHFRNLLLKKNTWSFRKVKDAA
jgi:hypothetical protein